MQDDYHSNNDHTLALTNRFMFWWTRAAIRSTPQSFFRNII